MLNIDEPRIAKIMNSTEEQYEPIEDEDSNSEESDQEVEE